VRPLILLAPGAGAPSSSPWMARWAERLSALGDVERIDYPYALAGRRSPDRLPVLVAAHAEALARARAGRAGPVVLAGKSMGSRVGCHVALEVRVDALVCLGYPLRGAAGALRDEVLVALRTPVLFVQGTQDRLCPLELLEDVRRRMPARSTLHVVAGGDHSLAVAVRALREQGTTQEDVDRRALAGIEAFLREVGVLAPVAGAGGRR
jgi:predicted alpha/beta-hydrolase family hydrolase